MSKSGGTTKTVSASGPAPFHQPYIDQLLQQGQQLYQAPGPQFYPGSLVAPLSDQEKRAQSIINDYTAGNLFNDADVARGTIQKLTNPANLDPATNPYYSAARDAAVRPLFSEFTQQVLPNLRGQFIGSGQLGSSRNALAEQGAVDKFGRSVGEVTNQYANQFYQNQFDNVTRALSLAPSISQMEVLPIDLLSSSGALNRAQTQAEINADRQRWDYEQALPYMKLAEYANLIRYPYGGYGESATIAPQNTAGNIAGISLASLALLPQILKLFGLG